MKGKERLNLVSRKSAMQGNKNIMKRARETKRNHISSVGNNNTNNHNISNSVINVCIWRRWNNK